MFILTVAHDPVRVIILIAASFFWLLSLLISSLWWFAVVPLRGQLAFGLVFSAENGLKRITDDSMQLIQNKHILAYVSGLGFGIISGMFSLVNVVADAVGPGTMGLKSGTQMFFIVSAAISLCFILLHTFWSVIFFNALDNGNKLQVIAVVASHLLVSGLTLLNRYHIYWAVLIPLYTVVVIMMLCAFKVAGGTFASFKASFTF
ncbi:hypothetical protein FQR65_LT16550 [Abscondita terminalis]|nr:hypothetical protein FQR65_LT16550 [Abscondita terminalis]